MSVLCKLCVVCVGVCVCVCVCMCACMCTGRDATANADGILASSHG